MNERGAASALAQAVIGALRGVAGLSGVFDGTPMQAGDAHAVVEMGPETDWGHKSGTGAELRLAVLIRCAGEQPIRARALGEEARSAVEVIGGNIGGWQVVSLITLRSRTVREAGPGWTAAIEFRARLLKEE